MSSTDVLINLQIIKSYIDGDTFFRISIMCKRADYIIVYIDAAPSFMYIIKRK